MPLRVIVAAEKPFDGELSLIAPDGSVAAKSTTAKAGRLISGTPRSPRRPRAPGARRSPRKAHRLAAARSRTRSRCAPMRRRRRLRPRAACGRCTTPGTARRKICIRHGSRNSSTDRLDTELSWPTLYDVLRDKSRNMLFNYLGLGEEGAPMSFRPDCADAVYFLRAYFAFKMGLPFGYSNCSRGDNGKPPKCYGWFTILNARSGEAAGFGGVVRPLFADRRRRRSVRQRAGGGERRQHRFLYRTADARYAAPGDHLCRSIRTHSNAGAARAGGRRRTRRLPRRRRGARRVGDAQAVLARQFPVRARSHARQSGLQALPADRARGERQLAAIDQRRDRERSGLRRFFARSVAAQRPRLLRSDG